VTRIRREPAKNDLEDAVPAKTDSSKPTPESQLRSFLDRFDPKQQKLFGSVRAAVRKRFPTANELAYDYADSVVISYSPTEGGIDGIVAISARPDGVRLYVHGPRVPDPKGLLQGTGKLARFVPVEAPSRLAHPDVKALIDAAVDQARVPLPPKGRGTLIIRSDGAKKLPRKKAKK
jgi:hypothetical protein